MSSMTFKDVEQALCDAQAPLSAAEAQGCLCGALCVLPQFSLAKWVQELLPEDAAEAALHADPVLQQLHMQTVTTLAGDDMTFAPLLPTDNAVMSERITALAQWAQGFLYGFGIGLPEQLHQTLPGDIPEVLKDLSEIARAGSFPEEDAEAEEQAYAELVEYLRAAVQLLYAELAPQRDTQQAAPKH